MPGRVIDASVLAALVFDEEEAAEALALIDGHELYAPPLLSYELASVARKKARRYPEQREGIVLAFELGLRLRFTWIQVNHAEVLKEALDTGLSTYDAAYLHVARAMALPLITFDKQLAGVYARESAN